MSIATKIEPTNPNMWKWYKELGLDHCYD